MRPQQAPFPATRLRRTRQSEGVRAWCVKTTFVSGDLIWPVFVRSGRRHGRAGALYARCLSS